MVGMTCGRCVNYIQTKMGEVEGVVDTVVSLEDSEAIVTYDREVMDSTAVAEAVDKVGSKFTARLISEVGPDAVQHSMVPRLRKSISRGCPASPVCGISPPGWRSRRGCSPPR